MAIRLITGRLQQGSSRYCAKEQQILHKTDGCHYVWQKAQTATLHYTRGPAE